MATKVIEGMWCICWPQSLKEKSSLAAFQPFNSHATADVLK
jgi:hypothetical protein